MKPFTTTQLGMENAPRPEVGDKDSVLMIWEGFGSVYYILERFGRDNAYRTDHFATLPDSSADEMADAEKEAIANLETVLV